MSDITRIHLLEFREKDHLSGRWSPWKLRDQYYLYHRTAKRYRDTTIQDHRDYQCRIVTFERERTYQEIEA